MAYTLPPLAYPYNALEPHIDARTMEIHHTKHHQAYINNVNNALKGKADLENKSVEDLIANLNAVPEDIQHADGVAIRQQRGNKHRTEIASAASDQNLQGVLPTISISAPATASWSALVSS